MPVGWDRLDRSFEEARDRLLDPPSPLVVLFSGGVDSGLLAWELRTVPGTSLVTVGLPGASDLAQARAAVPHLGLPWREVLLAEEEVRTLDSELRPMLGDVPAPGRRILVALAAAIARAPPGRLVCGQGADELFFGYAHYRGLGADAAAARSAGDLAALRADAWPATLRLAALWERELRAPFLDPGFVAAASTLPAEDRLPGELTKPAFRAWARHRGLPEELVTRPKRALQYGTGIDRLLRRYPTGPG